MYNPRCLNLLVLGRYFEVPLSFNFFLALLPDTVDSSYHEFRLGMAAFLRFQQVRHLATSLWPLQSGRNAAFCLLFK
jgi:hypothetical protein